jgi:hypothetical protein
MILGKLGHSQISVFKLLCTGTMVPGNIEKEEDEKAEQQTTGRREQEPQEESRFSLVLILIFSAVFTFREIKPVSRFIVYLFPVTRVVHTNIGIFL